jgi:hypothetical protein
VSASLCPFIKSAPPYTSYTTMFWYLKWISVHNDKWYLQLCDLFLPEWGLVSKLWFCVVHLEAGMNKQSHTVLWSLIPCPTVLVLCGIHATLYTVSFLWPVLTTLHLLPASWSKGLVLPVGWLYVEASYCPFVLGP